MFYPNAVNRQYLNFIAFWQICAGYPLIVPVNAPTGVFAEQRPHAYGAPLDPLRPPPSNHFGEPMNMPYNSCFHGEYPTQPALLTGAIPWENAICFPETRPQARDAPIDSKSFDTNFLRLAHHSIASANTDRYAPSHARQPVLRFHADSSISAQPPFFGGMSNTPWILPSLLPPLPPMQQQQQQQQEQPALLLLLLPPPPVLRLCGGGGGAAAAVPGPRGRYRRLLR